MALKSGRVGIHPSQVDPITGMLLAGPGGTTDYTQLTNKPQINSVTLTGNKSLSDLGIATSFDTLTDSDINNPAVGQTLQYNGTGWENVYASISPITPATLASLQDVAISSVQNKQILQYDGTAAKWENEDLPTIPTKVSELTNDSGFITISSVPTKVSELTNDSGYITISSVPTKVSELTNDSGFITISSVPTTLPALQDVTIDNPSNGDYLVYDSANSKWVNSASAPAPVVPDGSTVTPTDDIQTWLACADITDKTYTTVNEVLADSTTLLALISDNNASKYLVRSTTWASAITANSTAMTDIGANNYCADTLLSNSTWCAAICNSTYFESVLTVKVPTMTDATHPSGEVVANSYRSGREPYKAFDGNDTTIYTSSDNEPIADFYLGYHFPSAVKIRKVRILADSYDASAYFDNAVYGGNSLSSLTKLSSDMRNQAASGSSQWSGSNFVNNTAYTYYVIKITGSNQSTANGSNWWDGIYTLQFYGR